MSDHTRKLLADWFLVIDLGILLLVMVMLVLAVAYKMIKAMLDG